MSQPPELFTRSDVARALGVPGRSLTWWIYALRPPRRYRRFEIVRRSGAVARQIHAPIKPIKEMQRRLADILTACYEPPPYAHGFVPGRSPLSNARRHQRKHWVLKVDIEDFFPSINFGRVRGMFMAYPFDYPPEVATTLAQLCCHDNQLPQGAPTSPIVSNFICRQLDSEISRLAQSERCHYTRYADDICISTDRSTFPAALGAWSPSGTAEIGQALLDVVQKNGFQPNREKTRLMRRTQRQRVTGLIVNDHANISSDYVRSLRNLLHIWRRYGEADAAKAFARFNGATNRPAHRGDIPFILVVRGRVQHVGSVKGWSSPAYRRLGRALQELDPAFRPRTLLELHEPQRVRIYTEGESDVLHLQAADRYFKSRGEFANLQLEFPEDAAQGGDRPLQDKYEALAQSAQALPTVFVFDQDNPEIVRKAVGPGPYKDHGNGVAAVAIVPPPWRDESVSIELLYEDGDLQRRDDAGRRLYLRSEFHPRTGHHKTERVHITNTVQKTLVREDVYSLDDGRSLGLSKVNFANAVLGGEGEFAAPINFEGFRRTFEAIQEAVVRLTSPIGDPRY